VLQSEAEKQAAREKLFADIPPESKESEEPKA
jgi:hypothetical protein